jgi:flagellar hook-associated protein 1
MSDLMRIGSSAMNAAYTQLQTAGQNIANAATPGYVRREVTLQEVGNQGANGFTGRGVDAVAVRRVYDEFLVRESASSKAAAAQDNARSESLGRLDRLFADPATGVGAAFDDLVGAFSDVSARPSDPSARSAVLARTEVLASRVSTLDGKLLEMREGAHGRMQNEVAKANDALEAIGRLNRQIGEARGSVGEPNSLFDQRDKLIADLNGVLRSNAVVAGDGTVTVTTARGEPLVVGPKAVRLTLSADPVDPTQLDLAVVRGNGTALQLSASEAGGSLAGLSRFAGEDLNAARARLGQIAAAVATRFNDQQARGLDAGGTVGQPLFALGQAVVNGSTENTGTAQFSAQITDGSALRASDYRIEWDGGQYSVTRESDGDVRTFASMPQQFDGLSVSVGSGAPAAGDRYLLRAASAFAGGMRSLQVNAERIATALPVTAENGASNAGDLRAASIDITAIGPTTGLPVTVTFTSPTTFNLTGGGTGNPSGIAYTPGMQLEYNGWSVKLEGAPAAGDTMRIVPTANPAYDNRNSRAMQAIGDETFVDGSKLIDRFAELVGDVGTRSQSSRAAADMSSRLHQEAERANSELSGVNLDEEAAKMLQYQQAYQAAAKVIATANEMFRALLDAAG